MKILAICLFVLVFGLSVFAQGNVIRWDANDKTGCCSNYIRDNELHTFYGSEKVSYLVVLYVNLLDGYIVANIRFQNQTDRMITIDPTKFSLVMTEPINKTYLPIEAATVAKKVQNKGSWREILAAGLAGMATKQTTATVTDNRGNQSDITVRERDTAAQDNVNENIRQGRATKAEKADIVLSGALPAHTMFKNEIKGGMVYFKKEKLAPGCLLRFELDGITYEVPYGAERKNKD